MTKSTATSAFFGIFRKSNQNARSIRLWRGISGSLIFSYNTAKYREAMTLEISLRAIAHGFESHPLRHNATVIELRWHFSMLKNRSRQSFCKTSPAAEQFCGGALRVLRPFRRHKMPDSLNCWGNRLIMRPLDPKNSSDTSFSLWIKSAAVLLCFVYGLCVVNGAGKMIYPHQPVAQRGADRVRPR